MAQAVEREGIKFEPTAQVGGAALQLNGTGVRTRAIFKVYAAGLYVPQKANSAAALLSQKGPRRLSLTMLRNVDAESFCRAAQRWPAQQPQRSADRAASSRRSRHERGAEGD